MFWESVLNSSHQQFIKAVKDGRGERLADNSQLFSGLVWNGEQAMELGLVDGLGSASYIAREIIQSETILDYTLRPTPFEELTERFAVAVGKGIGYAIEAAFPSTIRLQ